LAEYAIGPKFGKYRHVPGHHRIEPRQLLTGLAQDDQVRSARTLKTAGPPIGLYDMLIAARALRSGATLVAANVKGFSRVRGLAWQDWSAAA
jgi:hypothetical protein